MPGDEGIVYALSVSDRRGDRKRNVRLALFTAGFGIEGDAHAGTGRPVSLLPFESFAKLDPSGGGLRPGDFAENITTSGIDFSLVRVGSLIRVGGKVVLEVVQIGKECHENCEIRRTAGDCIMPREGAFARVVNGGVVRPGDPVVIMDER